ncbi:DUF998 domain-containing protein [Cumulibacter soli]|uniref:DUF998 domain-containing protein n=1 Tax=Cumulibacter soli TaxID=2546344 RepID=UPI001067C5E9|nr:DUF998 domain-containing protein [Cumulibacter soli]
MTTTPVSFRPLAVPAAATPTINSRGSVLPSSLASIGALTAIAAMVAIHVLMAGSVDPVSQTLSMYGVATASSGLFAVACTALALAVVSLASHLPVMGRISAYLGAVMLELVVIFPTDAGSGALSLSAQIHRYAAAAAFVLLAVAIMSYLPQCSARLRHSMLVILVGVALALLLTIAAALWPTLWSMDEWRGIPQRLLMFLEASAIAMFGLRVWRASVGRGVRNSAEVVAG